MFGILICLIKMFHRHFSRYGQKADLKTLPRGRWSQRCEFNFNPAPSSPAGRRLLVHTLESPNQPQPPSWENAGADWGRICPINRGRTDRWLAPREPLGLAEGWDGIARVWYNLPASVTQTPPCLAPTTQSPPTPHKPNPHSAHWPKLSKPAREALHYQKCSFFAVAANDLWLPRHFW